MHKHDGFRAVYMRFLLRVTVSPRVALLTQGHLGCSLLVLVDDAGASWEGGHARLMGKGWTLVEGY